MEVLDVQMVMYERRCVRRKIVKRSDMRVNKETRSSCLAVVEFGQVVVCSLGVSQRNRLTDSRGSTGMTIVLVLTAFTEVGRLDRS